MNAAPIDADAAARLLAEGVHDQRVRKVAEALLSGPSALSPDARELSQAAVAACAAISFEMREVQAVALAAMRSAGVAAEAEPGPEDHDAAQFHFTAISIPRASLKRAAEIAAEQGFHPPVRLTDSRLRVLERVAARLRLVRFDGVSARLDLRLSERPPSRLPRALQPGLRDLAVAELPASLWRLYWALRPYRLARARIAGAEAEPGETDLVGTPDSLVEPIFRSIALCADDTLLDLGCGDGRVVATAASRFGCRAIGYEIAPDLIRAAQSRCSDLGPAAGLCEIRRGALETADLSEATVIFLFLPPRLAGPAIRRALTTASSSAQIVSHEQIRIALPGVERRSVPLFSGNAMTVVTRWRSV